MKCLMVEFAVKYTPEDLKDEAEFRKQYLSEINNVANKDNTAVVPIQDNTPQKVSPKAVGVPQAANKVATAFKEVTHAEKVTSKNETEAAAVMA